MQPAFNMQCHKMCSANVLWNF